MSVRSSAAAAALVLLGLTSAAARAEPTAFAIRTLGAPAVQAIGRRHAIVRHPSTVDARALGMREIVPGISVFQGDPPTIAGFARAHLDFDVEMPPPMRLKLDVAKPFVGATAAQLGSTPLDGTGTYVGIVDTGVDIFHNDFRHADGTTRIAYYLDFAEAARPGKPLDTEYGARVFERAEIDAILKGDNSQGVPGDDDGHGTHVAGIAAGNGGPSKKYVGLAPGADLVVVRAADAQGNVDEATAILGVKFVFDRAKADLRPAAVNMSLGTQFGAHDGSSSFEQGLVALVQGPGRAISVAASNEGAFAIHTSVRVSKGARFSIPVNLPGADGKGRAYASGQVFTWLNFRDRGDVKVGVNGPDGSEWMPLLERGQASETRPSPTLRVVVANDDHKNVEGDTSGAVVLLSGTLPVGNFTLELEGDGAVEMWLQGAGQAIDGIGMPGFPHGAQVAGTIGIPASAAGVLSIGCVGSRTSFTNSSGRTEALDRVGVGEPCFFSSAGPSATGAIRPDVLAPGYFVISSLAKTAFAAAPNGEFSLEQIVDPEHGALAGTSMSAPFGTGAAALLFERDPQLAQEDVRALFMAGARPIAGAKDSVHGFGILDVGGALAAYDRKATPPRASSLKMHLGDYWLAADGKLPLWGVATAHDDQGKPADVEGGLVLETDGANVYQALQHPAVGVYRFAVVASSGRGGTSATLRVRGTLSDERQVPIGADRWDALGGVTTGGGCSTTRSGSTYFYGLIAALTFLGRSRSRSRAAARAARSNATAGAQDLPR
ncbi:MAG: S8 family serine peptidase [Polyangiales bacterium]